MTHILSESQFKKLFADAATEMHGDGAGWYSCWQMPKRVSNHERAYVSSNATIHGDDIVLHSFSVYYEDEFDSWGERELDVTDGELAEMFKRAIRENGTYD